VAKTDRRDELLRVAAALFSEKGYHATSIRDIAESFGTLSGSLYSHISKKSDLLYELTANVEREVLEGVTRAARAHWDPVLSFRAALAAHFAITAKHMYMAKVALTEWRALEGEQRAEVVRLRDDYEALWTEIIDRGVSSGVLGVPNVRLAVLTVLSVGNWLYQWYQPSGALSPEELADAFADYLLNGFLLRADGAGAAAPSLAAPDDQPA
jgi:AcrR family transcriptional regulator